MCLVVLHMSRTARHAGQMDIARNSSTARPGSAALTGLPNWRLSVAAWSTAARDTGRAARVPDRSGRSLIKRTGSHEGDTR